MLNPIVSLYAAATARMATATPSPISTTHRPSPDPIPARGFHFHHGSPEYGSGGPGGSAGLLVWIGGIAVLTAVVAWLFLLWRQRHPHSAYAAPHPPHSEASGWDG